MEGDEEIIHIDDYSSSFRDTVWLSQWPLNQETVMYYFAASQFYDTTSNNERLKMQGLGLERLRSMRGVEYELCPLPIQATGQPTTMTSNLFLIVKQRRDSQTSVRPLAFYYVLDGTIYQAPNLQAVLGCRLRACADHLSSAFEVLSKGIQFSATEGYSWAFDTETKDRVPIALEGLALRLRRKADWEKEKAMNDSKVQAIIVKMVKKMIPEAALAKKSSDEMHL